MNIGPVKTSRTNGLVTVDTATCICAGPCNLVEAILSVKATARWIKFYDKATAPVNTDTPVLCIYVPAAGVPPVLNFGPTGFPFKLGLGFRMCVNGIDSDATYTSFAADDSCVTTIYQPAS